jgi:SAM-dependent methyltransferase
MSEQFWETLRGGLRTRAAAVAAGLGVADALADGPRPVADVAREVGADADTLNRYLRALAADGLFTETEPGVYGNTPASELLRRETPTGAFAQLFGGPWLEGVARLDASGRASFDDYWARIEDDPHERRLFDLAMAEGKERRVDRVADLEWPTGTTVVDVGGGNGSFLLELVSRRPGLHGIVFDLPETVRDEEELAAAGIEFAGGSFFERVPSADVYVLGTILHDWDDDHARAILETIREHAPAGARVLILDDVLQPGNDPQGGKWLDLLMLMIGGRERTEPEWHALVGAAGLRLDALRDGLIEATCP